MALLSHLSSPRSVQPGWGRRFFNDRLLQRLLLAVAVVFSCLVLGMVTASYSTLFGNSPAKLALLPVAMVVLILFLLSPLRFFLGVLVLRSVGDPIFNLAKLPVAGGGTGLGGLLNVMVIAMVLMFIIHRPSQLSRRHAWIWSVWIVGVAAAIPASLLQSEAIRTLVGFMSNVAVFMLAFYCKPDKHSALRYGAQIVVWASILPTLYGLYEFVTQVVGGGFSGFRAMSTFTHANIYAFFLVLVLTLLLYMIKDQKQPLTPGSKTGLWLYFGLQFFMLGLTMTRSAWLGIMVVMAVYGLLFERRWLVYLAILPALAMLVPQVQDRVLDLGKGNEVVQNAELNSFAWRLALWEAGFNYMDAKAYLIGYGLESFRKLSLVFFPLAGGTMWGSHSVYVQVIFEFGLLGCLPSVWVFWMVIRDGLTVWRTDRLAGFIVLAIIVQYLVTSASDNMLYYLAFNWYFWFVLGCAAVDARESIRNRRHDGVPDGAQFGVAA